MSAHIIHRPEWQSRRQRTLYAAITLVFWAAWFYLWMPVMTFIAWLFGFRLAYEHMIGLDGYLGLANLLGVYALVIAIMGSSLIAWALYNYFRFKGVERRAARPAVDISMLCDSYRVDHQRLAQWQQAHRLVIHQDAHSNIIGVDTDNEQWVRHELLPDVPVAKLIVKYLGEKPTVEWIGKE